MTDAALGERPSARLRWRPATCVTAAVAACWVATPGDADAFPDTGYPYPGVTEAPAATVGAPEDVQHQIAGGPAALQHGVPDPGWTILPRIDVSEAFNDNIFQTSTNRQTDFITYITPSIQVLGDLPRLQTRIFYAPTGVIYASHGSQDFVAQNFNGSATMTVVPDTVFLDMRGYAGVQPRFGGLPAAGGNGFGITSGTGGGFGNAGSSYASRDNSAQTLSFTVAPYAVHRFGTFGTVKAGYAYTYSAAQSLPGSDANDGYPYYAGNQSNGSVSSNTEVLQFTSGEDFGRFRNFALITGTQYSGGGVTSGAYQYMASNQLGYAITRQVTVFGELGVEDIRFNGYPATKLQDAIWAVGVEYVPNPGSSITVGYGHKYGADSFLLNAGYSLTARTRVYAQFQTGLGTDLTELQAFTINTDVDRYGNSVDPTTGAPAFNAMSALGISGNSNLYRNRTFSVGGVTNLDRDQLSLQAFLQDRKLVATTNTYGASSSTGVSAVATWQHQVSEATSTTVGLSYGRQDGSQFFGGISTAVEDTYAAQASVKYNFTETLSGIAQYTFIDRHTNVPGLSFTQNIVLVGVSKQF